MTETSLSQRDGSISSTNSGGGASAFLSKITRSPSRRHKPLGSNGSIDATLSVTGSTPPRPRPRPGYPRTTTAPAAPVTLNAIKADIVARNSDVTGASSASSQTMFPIAVDMVSRTPLQKSPSDPNTIVSNGLNGKPASTIADGFKAVPSEMDIAYSLATNGMLSSSATAALTNGSAFHAHIQEMTTKRIATLDYLRKAHEGRSFWFNTVRFTEADICKLPSYTVTRLSRRAMNYMLLGMSLPIVIDVHPQPHAQSTAATMTAVAQDYLRSLNTLLAEFESFQQLHPPDGSTASSLSRARIPQMFKRSGTIARPRKSSGPVSEIGLPMLPPTSSPPSMPEGGHHHVPHASIDTTATGMTFSSNATTLVTPSPSVPLASGNFASASAFPPPGPFDAPNSTLLTNEGPYTYLQTPPLPFSPDFFTVFATLCDVLIDTYQRLIQILGSSSACTPLVSDLFNKVDARIRKVMISAVVREFESASRENAKRELMGVQKVVLVGLMA
ncbi:hypothetical protein LTR84_001494 [Exophiala bonariae]|uniref:Uncharacterized protein n=1 Tax=Exophiala bonariae TaxID=1690606 RepID=A0AAV9NGA2_9EURO|nr:hypothetical protein LTR84_001494 [Exophiala bonariae]